MNYKIFFLSILLFINSCIENPINVSNKDIKSKSIQKSGFSNEGFTLIYSEDLRSNKLISKKIDERDMLIFQKNLKKNTSVKITNLLNNRYILAKVGSSAKYPDFYNSVVSKRIAKELDLNVDEPYVQIKEIFNNSSFVANVTKTFDEEKNVATKVPVDEIKISNLNIIKKSKMKKDKKDFNYIIKIADLYFKDSANNLAARIKKETLINKVFVKNLSKTKYRVFLGPFKNINLLQKTFNDIKILEFENIEIVYND